MQTWPGNGSQGDTHATMQQKHVPRATIHQLCTVVFEIYRGGPRWGGKRKTTTTIEHSKHTHTAAMQTHENTARHNALSRYKITANTARSRGGEFAGIRAVNNSSRRVEISGEQRLKTKTTPKMQYSQRNSREQGCREARKAQAELPLPKNLVLAGAYDPKPN